MEIKYAIDQIIDEVIVIENLNDGQIEYIFKQLLDFEVNEGDILILKDGVFSKDEEEYKKRMEVIQEKFNRVRRSK